MLNTTWDDAEAALAEESRLLQLVGGDFAAAQELHDQEVEQSDQGDPVLQDLDVGVASAVIALSAAGYLTVSSCSGLPGHHEVQAVIALVADAVRLEILETLCLELGLSIDTDEWVVLTGELKSFIGIGPALYGSRARFEELEAPREPSEDEEDDWERPLYPSWGPSEPAIEVDAHDPASGCDRSKAGP